MDATSEHHSQDPIQDQEDEDRTDDASAEFPSADPGETTSKQITHCRQDL
jgi:hypothetical protein